MHILIYPGKSSAVAIFTSEPHYSCSKVSDKYEETILLETEFLQVSITAKSSMVSTNIYLFLLRSYSQIEIIHRILLYLVLSLCGPVKVDIHAILIWPLSFTSCH